MTYPHGTDAASGERQSMTRTFLPAGAGGRGAAARRAPASSGWSRTGTAASGPSSPGPTGGPCTIDFEHVVVCAGAIQTPALLQRSGHRGLVGRNLAVHPP